MVIKKRNTDKMTMFIQDNDWESVRMQILKMVDKINELESEIIKLKAV